jgi:hypothetical protein
MTAISEPAADARNDLWSDMQPLLDQVVARLPEKYRAVIVLRELDGKTGKVAAREAGCPEGTVASRLTRARTLLAKRLARHGLAVSGGTIALLSQRAASASVPGSVLSATLKILTLASTGHAMTGSEMSANAVALTERMLRAMSLQTVKAVSVIALSLFAVGVVVLGAGLHRHQATAQQAPDRPLEEAAKNAPAIEQDAEQHPVDHYGDPLPPGAVARLGTLRFRTDGEAWTLAFGRGGKLLVTTPRAGILVWDATTGKQKYRLPIHVQRLRPGGPALAVSPDGTTLAVVELSRSEGGSKIGLWDLQSGKPIRSLALPKAANALTEEFGSSICFTMDGKRLVITRDGRLSVLDLDKGDVKTTFGDPRAAIYSLACSPDGKTLAVGTHEPGLQLWDIDTGIMLRGINDAKDGQRSAVGAVAFSRDGKMVASGTWDRITVFDALTGTKLGRLEAEMQSINGLAFTPEDSDQFGVREAAAQELERLGLQVESSIKKALEGKPTLETRRRLDQVRLSIHGVPDHLLCELFGRRWCLNRSARLGQSTFLGHLRKEHQQPRKRAKLGNRWCDCQRTHWRLQDAMNSRLSCE